MANSTANHISLETSAVVSQIKRQFADLFPAEGKAARVFQAPGRVNLIGEHTDYNDGFVMPAAIDFHTWVAAAPRSDKSFVVHSTNFDETVTFALDDQTPSAKHHWSDYVRGVVLQLRNAGVTVGGTSLLLNGNVPLGSGLSSSASIEMAVAFALNSLFNGGIDRRQLATLCQRAENEFVGARCGIMDQFISAHGQQGHALMLDCRSLEYELLPLPSEIALVICNTMVKHSVASGEYNVRRQECETGVALLQQTYPDIKALRDVTPAVLEKNKSAMPDLIYRRCHHVVSENQRVLDAASALKNSDLKTFGRLMYASHRSLRDDFQVSCRELDIMVDIASNARGVIGARMTGGGFGGCTINLVDNAAVEEFRHLIAENYKAQTGIEPSIYTTQSSDGASEVTNEN